MRLSPRSFLDCELPEGFPRYPKHSGPFQILSSLTSLPIRGSGWSNQVCLKARLREDAGPKERASRGTSQSTPGEVFLRGALCAPVLHGLTDVEGLHYWEGLAGSWLPEGGMAR
jgi:hypothetical protein